MAKKYEVEVDGEAQEVTTKKEVREIVEEAAFDGEEHTVSVEVVDESAKEDEAAAEEAPAAPADAPAGIPHYL